MINYSNLYKELEKCGNGFWTAKNILTYGKPVNVVTGTRSVGKSTGVAVLCLLDYLKNKHKFMYVRRRQRDTYKTCKTFFNNAVTIVNRYTDYKINGFKFYNGNYLICTSDAKDENDNYTEWEVCGQANPLSSEEELKSSVYSDYFTVVYDEFISKDPNKYLGTRDNPDFEWDSVVSLYQTIDRGVLQPFRNETALFLLGNKSTIYNPICLSIGIADYVNAGAHFTSPKNKTWVWEDVDHVESASTFNESYAFQMSSDSVKRYAYENLGNDNNYFIKKPDASTVYVATIKFKGVCYGVKRDFDFNYYIVKPVKGYSVIALDVDSHDGNDLHLIRRWSDSPIMCTITEAYKQGRLYFDSGKNKVAILKYLQFMP